VLYPSSFGGKVQKVESELYSNSCGGGSTGEFKLMFPQAEQSKAVETIAKDFVMMAPGSTKARSVPLQFMALRASHVCSFHWGNFR
jgi:hypothetical protein